MPHSLWLSRKNKHLLNLPSGSGLKSAGGTSADYENSVSTDDWGNVYVTGYFVSDSLTFGSIVLTNGGGYGDIFIAKYDSNGTVLWAKGAGGTRTHEQWENSLISKQQIGLYIGKIYYQIALSNICTNFIIDGMLLILTFPKSTAVWGLVLPISTSS